MCEFILSFKVIEQSGFFSLLTEVCKESPNKTSVSNSTNNNQQRRFSIESNSSGRGGSSGMSSAEGLGGVTESCQIECNKGKISLYQFHSQQQQQLERDIPLPIFEIGK